MKKMLSGILLGVMALTIAGCAQKSDSEKLRDDMKNAGNKMQKDMNSMLK